MGNTPSSEKNKSNSYSGVFLVFLFLFSLWTVAQLGFLWYSNNNYKPNLQDNNARNILNALGNWAIAIGVFLILTIILGILYFVLGRSVNVNLTRLLIIWFILMFIVNLILLGYGFYFLSVVLNSTDYSSDQVNTQSNANNLKNNMIALLAFTGGNLITIIIALIYYYYFGTTSYRFGRFFGGDKSIDEFFKEGDLIAEDFDGPTCGKNFSAYQKQAPIIEDLETRYSDRLDDPNVKAAFGRAAKLKKINITPQE